MIIGVDLRQIVLGPTGGLSQLLQGVLDSAIELGREHQFFVFCTIFNRTLLSTAQSNVQFHTLPLSSYYSDVDKLCAQNAVDVLFRGYPVESTLTFPQHRTVYQIPDIQHEYFPDFFTSEALRSRRAAFDVALSQAGAIGTISEFARHALRSYSKTKVDDIFLMPPALQRGHSCDAPTTCSTAELQLIPSVPFFIFPANLWPHKNHESLAAAFDIFCQTLGTPFELVLTGHPAGWEALSAKFPRTKMRHLGFVRPHLLRALLERSVAMTYFSLHEGFGMPLLEAFDAHTAVLCSNTSSLPEVGGDALLSCDPTDVEAIAKTMLRVVRSPDLRAQLIERGTARISAYNWNTSALALLAACSRVAIRAHDSHMTSLSTQTQPPLVSIVTPSYNQGQFLRRTIESVLSQSYKNIELIVMDGGSSDESIEILQSYKGRIQWVSEQDGGQTDAINKGLTRATGSILAYLNSDDVLHAGAIAKVVDYFATHQEVSLVYGKAHYIDRDDNIIADYPTIPYSRESLNNECIICQPATFWRRELQNNIGRFDESLHYVMDYDYWLRAAVSGANIVYLEEYLACSRLYPETKTLSARDEIFRELFDMCGRHNQYIALNYFIGHWEHKFHERDGAIGYLLKKRRLHVLLGRLSFIYANRAALARAGLNKLNFRRGRWFLLLASKLRTRRYRWLWRFAKTLEIRFLHKFSGRIRGTSLESSTTRVSGLYADNWLMSELYIANPRQGAGWTGFLQGRSPHSQTVKVFADDKLILTQELTFDSGSRIELQFPNQSIAKLKVRFSRRKKDDQNRLVSFDLHATNLFSEHDLILWES